MDINQFRNMFSNEGGCRRYLEKMIWPAGGLVPTVAVCSPGGSREKRLVSDSTSVAVVPASSR